MLIGELKIKFPPVCKEHTSLEQLYSLLTGSPERLVVVIDGDAHRVPIGVITERSICEQIIGRRREPRDLSAANVLDCDIIKVEAGSDLRDVPRVFGTGKPVVVIDSDRRYQGIVDTASIALTGGLASPDFVPSSQAVAAGSHPIMGLA
ncbi:MAG TPA: CBS domain-containing protein [Pyrinomonadaceae bacterium]|nr:CBS domain-containing protein [Pyrinomonadaceae bacterium]